MISSKRMQTFFNEFIVTTTTFLNDFASQTEERFFQFERKLQKIETNLQIIEAKLESIPSETSSLPKNLPEVEALKAEQQTTESVTEVTQQDQPEKQDATKEEPMETSGGNVIKISESAAYKKYFKMLKVGIPAPAVKIKMKSEGFDANLLDNPDLLIERTSEDDEVQ